MHGKVDGYALVIYKDRLDHLNTATISGDITGAANNDVAALPAEPFGAKSFARTGASVTLNGMTPEPYSFTVTPSLATRYEVQVSTGSTLDATSAAATVYATEGSAGGSIATHCSRGRCRTTWKVYLVVSTTRAFRTESAERWFLYFALDPYLPSPRGFPKYLLLYRNASASRARRINALEYETTFTFIFRTRIQNPGRHIIPAACTRDTESVDGYGLPGHHGCGNRKISTSAPYIG